MHRLHFDCCRRRRRRRPPGVSVSRSARLSHATHTGPGAAGEAGGVVVDGGRDGGAEDDKDGGQDKAPAEALGAGGAGVRVQHAGEHGARQPARGVGHVVEADVDGDLVAVRVSQHEVRVDRRVDGKDAAEQPEERLQAHREVLYMHNSRLLRELCTGGACGAPAGHCVAPETCGTARGKAVAQKSMRLCVCVSGHWQGHWQADGA